MSEPPGVLEYATPPKREMVIERSIAEKLLHAFVGEIVPIIYLLGIFLITLSWPSHFSRGSDRVEALLTIRCVWPFIPLMIFSMFGHFHATRSLDVLDLARNKSEDINQTRYRPPFVSRASARANNSSTG